MIKRYLSILIIILIASIAMNRAQAQDFMQARANAKVSGRVVTDFSAVKTSKMNLEYFPTQNWDGALITTPNENHPVKGNTKTGNKINYAANFYVSSDCNSGFSISIPNSPISLTNISENKILFVSDWKSSFLETQGAEFSKDGYKKVFIGASVEVGPYSYRPGDLFTGFYIVTFDFN